jgi:hypothetical protein
MAPERIGYAQGGVKEFARDPTIQALSATGWRFSVFLTRKCDIISL